MHRSSRILAVEIIVIIIIVIAIGVLGYPQFLPRPWHRFLHILGAVLLLGNVAVSAVWMVLAGQTKDPAVLRFASRAVNWADVIFTAPGVFLIITNGDILSQSWGGAFRTPWIATALALFALSGVLWIAFLLRYQHRMIQITNSAAGEIVAHEFERILRKWYTVGLLATIFPLTSLFIMVFKKGL